MDACIKEGKGTANLRITHVSRPDSKLFDSAGNAGFGLGLHAGETSHACISSLASVTYSVDERTNSLAQNANISGPHTLDGEKRVK